MKKIIEECVKICESCSNKRCKCKECVADNTRYCNDESDIGCSLVISVEYVSHCKNTFKEITKNA